MIIKSKYGCQVFLPSKPNWGLNILTKTRGFSEIRVIKKLITCPNIFLNFSSNIVLNFKNKFILFKFSFEISIWKFFWEIKIFSQKLCRNERKSVEIVSSLGLGILPSNPRGLAPVLRAYPNYLNSTENNT